MPSRNWWMSCLLPPWLTALGWPAWGGVRLIPWRKRLRQSKKNSISFHSSLICLLSSFHQLTHKLISIVFFINELINRLCLSSLLAGCLRLAAAYNPPKEKSNTAEEKRLAHALRAKKKKTNWVGRSKKEQSNKSNQKFNSFIFYCLRFIILFYTVLL